MPSSKTYYDLLGVDRDASEAEIHRAYKKKALQHHPDKNPGRVEEATELFKAIGSAYNCLRDPQKRAIYDHEIETTGWSSSFGTSEQASDGFTFHMAKDLFRETFGDEFTERLEKVAAETSAAVAQHVAPHLQAAVDITMSAAGQAASVLGGAAERCSQSDSVRSAVSAGLSSMALEAEASANRMEMQASERFKEMKAIEEERRQQETLARQESQRFVEIEEEKCNSAVASSLLAVCFLVGSIALVSLRFIRLYGPHMLPPRLLNAVPLATVAFLVSFTRCSRLWVPVLVLGCLVDIIEAFPASWGAPVFLLVFTVRATLRWVDFVQLCRTHARWREEDAQEAAVLAQEWRAAQLAYKGAQAKLAEAQSNAAKARQDVESVQRDGASLGSAARAGMHFVGRWFGGSSVRALE